MNRSDLHALVDTLPEGAFENAERVLQHLQTCPPQPSPETLERLREMQREQISRIRRSRRPGAGGGGSLRPAPSPEVERIHEQWLDHMERTASGCGNFYPLIGYGYSGRARWDGETVIHETFHLHKGHEIVVTEHLRLISEGKSIQYTHEAKGPKGDHLVGEVTFDLV